MVKLNITISLLYFWSRIFENIYPLSYQGYCKYQDLNMIFNTSRINLSTHVVVMLMVI